MLAVKQLLLEYYVLVLQHQVGLVDRVSRLHHSEPRYYPEKYQQSENSIKVNGFHEQVGCY